MSNKSKIILLIIILVLVIITIISTYFLIFAKDKENTNLNETENLSKTEFLNETNESQNTNIENTVSNTNTNTNKSVTKVNLSDETNSTQTELITNNSEANVDELKQFLKTYSVGIQRLNYNNETLESNTILLFLAKQFFDTNSNKKASLKVDTKYATTVENIHKYLTELTGNDYNNIEYLNSYKNYIGYSPSNKAYTYGSNIADLKNEEYECPKLELTEEKDGIYTAKGEVIRIRNNEETVYSITLTFKINPNYTYQKYQIISLKPANKSFYPDNTAHLVENTEVE